MVSLCIFGATFSNREKCFGNKNLQDRHIKYDSRNEIKFTRYNLNHLWTDSIFRSLSTNWKYNTVTLFACLYCTFKYSRAKKSSVQFCTK